MNKKLFLFLLFCWFNFINAQNSFKNELKKANPVKVGPPEVSIEEIIKRHKKYLNKAISEKNITKQLYANLYLFVDYYKAEDYVNLNKALLEAEAIVNNTNNYSWKGAIYMRKALVSDLNDNKQDVLKQYQLALENCRKAKDSLCIGECLEQLSTTYGQLDNFEKAHYYFDLALPILIKYADNQQLALTYNNYSNLMAYEGNFSESEKYIDSAITMTIKNKDLYKQMMYENNKASLLTSMKRYDEAVTIFKNAEKINIKNKWADRLKQNYIGLSVLYETKKDYQNAFDYLKEFYLLKDSINGLDVKLKMKDLDVKYKAKENELKLINSDKKKERYFWISMFLILGILFLIWKWRNQISKLDKKQKEHIDNLNELTNLLIDKNVKIKAQEELINKNQTDKQEDFELHGQRILTDADWSSFKEHFEKAYPSYISKVRNIHSSITESEERLFLCIKLGLRTKETASMLGISDDSVKKGRNRLRKRLSLDIKQDLVDYIRNF